jgi:glycosyltransferase involved in cell wall biosynthesis
MAVEANRYTNKAITITPFGINTDLFKPDKVQTIFKNGDIVIGTVRALKEVYGIEYLIRAFHILKRDTAECSLKLLIVGGGPLEAKLKNLANELELDNSVVFTGELPHDKIVDYYNMIDIYVSVSNSESFGVSTIEASACEKPVVVSNVGGLPEVVEDGITGIVVPPRDVAATAHAIEKLVLDQHLRQRMGKAGRERVKRLYDWNNNVAQMVSIYSSILTAKMVKK